MIAKASTGMLSAPDYARKHGVNHATVCTWAKEGRLNSTREGVRWYVEDIAPPYKISPEGVASSSGKRCGMCGRIRNRYAHYSPSRRSGSTGLCKDCNSHRERIRGGRELSPASISYAAEMAAWKEIQESGVELMALRESAIQGHIERIEDLGLAGDGEGFPDGQD